MSDHTEKQTSPEEDGRHRRSEELLLLLYQQLRRLAASMLAQERPGQTLQATALVHEAWLRVQGDTGQRWENRRNFFAAAAEAMRRILIDNARRKQAARHGGGDRNETIMVWIPAPFARLPHGTLVSALGWTRRIEHCHVQTVDML
jgi:RNA polymerase sigma factor (TIGR02999 family)